MQNQYNKTKSIVEAGLLSALIVIIMLLNVYVPIFSTVGTFLLPIPVTLLLIRYDFKITISAVIVSMVMIGVLYNPISAVVSGIVYGLTGVTLGYCIKRKFKGSLIIFWLTISSLISIVVSGLITIFLIYKENIYSVINEYLDMIKKSNEITQNISQQMGVPASQLDQVTKMWDIFTPEYIMYILPALILLSAFVSAFINYMVTRSILRKMKYEVNPLTPFEKVYLDNRVGALIIIVLCIGIILYAKGVSFGNYIFNSAFLILQFSFMIDGVSLLVYYLKNKFKISKIFMILIVVFALLSQLGIIFLYLGIADMIFDFRKLDPNRMLGKKRR